MELSAHTYDQNRRCLFHSFSPAFSFIQSIRFPLALGKYSRYNEHTNAENEQQRNGIGHAVYRNSPKQMLRKWQIFPLIKPNALTIKSTYTAHGTQIKNIMCCASTNASRQTIAHRAYNNNNNRETQKI